MRKNMEKQEAVYDKWNPNDPYVTSVAIQTETNPHYVWRCYSRGDIIPKLGSDLKILSINTAKNVYNFKKGKLEEVVK